MSFEMVDTNDFFVIGCRRNSRLERKSCVKLSKLKASLNWAMSYNTDLLRKGYGALACIHWYFDLISLMIWEISRTNDQDMTQGSILYNHKVTLAL